MTELAAAAAKSPSAWAQPGTLAFLVIFGMGVILFFVFKSLARQLRKINEAARLEAAQADAVQADATRAESTRAESTRAESTRAEALQDQGPPARGSLGPGLPPTV